MHNDCVVIPGWGALIANYQPSSTDGGVIERPRRLIVFNSSINHNDGMLATSLMRRHGMTYETACDFIGGTVATFRRQLFTGSELPMGHLGYFKLAPNELLEFVPMTDCESCDEYFGLANINTQSLTKHEATHDAAIVAMPISLRERMKVAASIAAIVGVGLLLSTPVIIDRSTQTASLDVTQVKKSEKPVMTVAPASASTKQQFVFIDNKGKEKPVEAQVSNTATPKKATVEDSETTLSLVLTTCHTRHKAEKLARRYSRKGVNTMIQEHEGDFRLVVAQSSSKQELMKIKDQLPIKCRGAHVSL